MTEIEDKNNETPPSPPDKAASNAPAATADSPQKSSAPALPPHVSKGEKLYNALVYKGINYWLNLGMSLYITDLFLAGKWRPTYDKWLGGVNKGLSAVRMEERFGKAAIERTSHVALGTVTLNSGGNLLLVPMKIMEDKKRPMVHWLNKHIFKEKQLAADGHEETPDQIYIEKEQPKQSWLRVIGRRLLAMGSTIVAAEALDIGLRKKFDTPQVVDGKKVTQLEGQDRFTDIVLGGANKLLGAVPGGKKMVGNATVQRYMAYASLDTIYTWITSFVMEKTNGAKKFKMPKEIGDDVDPPGVSGTDEIVALPPGEKIVDTVAPPSLGEDKLAQYRKKPIAPVQSHAERALADSGNSMGLS